MVTVHNTDGSKKVAKPFISSINPDPNSDWATPDGEDGWQAFSGKSTVTMPSPTSTAETETSYVTNLADSFLDNVNRARYIDIAVGIGSDDISKVVAKTGRTDLLIASQFGNWRKLEHNGLWAISARVMLQSKDVPKVDYSINYGDGQNLKDTVLKKGIGGKLSKITETVNEFANTAKATGVEAFKDLKPVLGERMSLYKELKSVTLADVKQSTGISELKFDFRFGQACIFSGEEEVVKPILAIVNIFALKTTNSTHSFNGPIPTTNRALSLAIESTIAVIQKKVTGPELKDLFKFDATDESIVSKMLDGLNGITDALYGVIDTVADAILASTTTVCAIIGSLVMGPYICTEVKWSFDFNDTDEYGFPCSGTITLSNLSPVRLLVGTDYVRQWGYSVGIGSSNLTNMEKKAITESGEKADEALAVIKSDGKGSSLTKNRASR